MICPLCEKEVINLHKRSHLIPEWTYQNCYYSNHKLIQVSIKNESVTKKQKGLHDEIICEYCETQSQIYDRYASLIFTEQSTESKEYASIIRHVEQDGNVNYEYWENVDFHHLQKFVFICLLRTHLSLNKAGSRLLPEKHFKKMRELYHSKIDVDSTTYPIMLIKYTDIDDARDIIFLPFVNRRDGHHVIQYYF